MFKGRYGLIFVNTILGCAQWGEIEFDKSTYFLFFLINLIQYEFYIDIILSHTDHELLLCL